MFELQQAAVGYDAVPILQNVSFTAQDGQITTLVGTNGCGKTTLLKAIAAPATIGFKSPSAAIGIEITL